MKVCVLIGTEVVRGPWACGGGAYATRHWAGPSSSPWGCLCVRCPESSQHLRRREVAPRWPSERTSSVRQRTLKKSEGKWYFCNICSNLTVCIFTFRVYLYKIWFFLLYCCKSFEIFYQKTVDIILIWNLFCCISWRSLTGGLQRTDWLYPVSIICLKYKSGNGYFTKFAYICVVDVAIK